MAILKLRFDQARYAETPGGTDIWLVPGRGVMCLVRAPRIATTCDTGGKAARRGLVLQVYKVGKSPDHRPTQFMAMGVAPDGARGVLVKVGHESRAIPIVDNAFDYKAKAPITVVHLTR
jgi:hypothetical protein